eukprot:2225523-Lingulodinium_polyedra.AAC.1
MPICFETAYSRGAENPDRQTPPPEPPPRSADMDEGGADLTEWGGDAELERGPTRIHIKCGR